LSGYAPTSRLLRRQNPERRKAGRLARGAADEVRAGHQPEGRESARPEGSAVAVAAGGSCARVGQMRCPASRSNGPAARIARPMVVTMRPIAEAQVDLVRELSSRYPHAH